MPQTIQMSRRKLSLLASSSEGTEADVKCELCSGSDIKFTSPQQWKSESAISLAESLQLPPASHICQACQRDISRGVSDSDFTPRWERVKGKPERVL